MELKKHLPFIILLLILTVYLGLKTLPENGWGGWGNGTVDAQALLSFEHWAKDGFIYSKFLFIPIGYSKIVQYLDNPEMRHHARGSITGGLIGNRLYYTHYPPGFIFLHALLMKAGVTQRYWFRLLALLFSFLALIFLYWFFNLISTPAIAFFAIFYYSISTMFLDIADSLVNQPLDDLFRAIILVLSILAVRSIDNTKKYRIYNGLIWFSFFLLSISSYDSTFFIFIWLVGLDIVTRWHLLKEGAEPRTKWLKAILVRGLFFASAPIFGFILQIAQNWWYLGWKDLWLDLKGSFLFRSSDGPGRNFLEKHIRSMFSPLAYMTDLRIRFALPVILAIAACFVYLKNKISVNWPNFKYFIVLILAGLAYSFVFVSSGYFPYQGRQWMPWLGLLIGSATVLLFSWPSRQSVNWPRHEGKLGVSVAFLILLLLAVVIVWGAQINRTVAYVKDWPNHKVDWAVINFYKSLKYSTQNDAVIFNIDNNFKTDYPYPDPIEEYYAGHTILNFRNFQDFLKDYYWLKNNSRYSFDAIIVSSQRELAEGLKGVLPAAPAEIKFENGNYFFALKKDDNNRY